MEIVLIITLRMRVPEEQIGMVIGSQGVGPAAAEETQRWLTR